MSRLLLACLGLALTGCAGNEKRRPGESELGFVAVPPDSYSISNEPLESGETVLFYGFRPAATDGDDIPLFVVTVGGPGGPVLLLADQLQGLTSIGHVLCIDARNSGFSYVVDPLADRDDVRASHFSAASYNVFRDAADVAEAIGQPAGRQPPSEILEVRPVGGVEVAGGVQADWREVSIFGE